MFRRVLLATGALALVAGTSVGIASGAASASSPPVQFSGSITCAVGGLTHFGPPLINNGSAASTVKVTATLKDCTGSTVQSGVTLKKGVMTVISTSTVTNNCGLVLEGNSLAPLSGQIKWTASGDGAATSSVSVASPTVDYNVNANQITTYLTSATTPTGSFAGDTASFSGLGSNKAGYGLDSKCGTSRGLGSIKFGKSEGTQTGTVTIQEGS
jgi:hypothetical protein